MSVFQSVLSECNNSREVYGNFMKFDIGEFHCKIGFSVKNWNKGTLQEYIHVFIRTLRA